MLGTDSFDAIVSRDPTWHFAYHFVRKHFDVPSHMYRLFRSGWSGELEPIDYLKVIGFSNLNPRCLIQAAEISGGSSDDSRGAIERAISFLGIRLSAVVLGIHLYTRLILLKKPPIGWQTFLKEMITDIERGYRLGSHASMIGVEGGALCGFALHAGSGLIMAADREAYKKYMALKRNKKQVSASDEISILGCEMYQLSAMIIQQLGYGTDMALAITLCLGRSKGEMIDANEMATSWKAAMNWIIALRQQRNYPKDVVDRKAFSEITPPPTGTNERNKRLEALYTEMAKLKDNYSSWMWHLPKLGYDETKELFGLP